MLLGFRILWLVALGILAGKALAASVEFPGPEPGLAKATRLKGAYILQNKVIALSWSLSGGMVEPLLLTNKLTGSSWNQAGRELFRLATMPQAETKGVYVGVRLETRRVVAIASKDGVSWTELASFPRSEFKGKPALVRLGKMNLKAESKDNPGDLGPVGKCSVLNFSLAKILNVSSTLEINARAHQGTTKDFGFPQGIDQVTCRIDKDTDQGMSWSPGLALVWKDAHQFLLVGARDGKSVFNVTTARGERMIEHRVDPTPDLNLRSSSFRCMGEPRTIRLVGSPKGQRLSDRLGGWSIEADLESASGVRAQWSAELRDGSNAIRQTVKFQAGSIPKPIYGIEMADLRLPDAVMIGTVPGCPVFSSGVFVGIEMPGSQSVTDHESARIYFPCRLAISSQQSYAFSSVTGVSPTGQLRRAFLYYLERERARPSSPFLHYNCWYDLGFSVDLAQMLDVVRSFDQELASKRGIRLQSFLVDDGWDDPSIGLWKENKWKFPGGFRSLSSEMAKLDAHLAIWISPLGGYGGAPERTNFARSIGIIPRDAELDLSYPAYKDWFQNRCIQLMREDGVNAFKWDRAGDGVSPHFMALLDIARNLRHENPKVFINVTVGTWPSPFWLNHVDSTWRNGSADVGWAGKGDLREKWLTFRDGYCKKMFVDRSPLYPLNSAMHHGIVHGRNFQGEPIGKTGPHLRHEARSYFANGSSLQELYITPSMMNEEAWNDLAEAAKWAQRNADVLVDSHWVGGNPLELQPYGYAAWNPRKSTLMVRNPDDKPQSVILDSEKVFELPENAPRAYSLKSPYRDQRIKALLLTAGKPVSITLEPFEVLVFDGAPKK